MSQPRSFTHSIMAHRAVFIEKRVSRLSYDGFDITLRMPEDSFRAHGECQWCGMV